MSRRVPREDHGLLKPNNEEVQELVARILRHFNKISDSRIHKLAFLSEYELLREDEQRGPKAEYYRVMDGCRSDDVSDVLKELNEEELITINTVSIGSEDVVTITPQDLSVSDSASSGEESIIEEIVSQYGEVPPREINEVMNKIEPYQSTSLGEKIELSGKSD